MYVKISNLNNLGIYREKIWGQNEGIDIEENLWWTSYGHATQDFSGKDSVGLPWLWEVAGICRNSLGERDQYFCCKSEKSIREWENCTGSMKPSWCPVVVM